MCSWKITTAFVNIAVNGKRKSLLPISSLLPYPSTYTFILSLDFCTAPEKQREWHCVCCGHFQQVEEFRERTWKFIWMLAATEMKRLDICISSCTSTSRVPSSWCVCPCNSITLPGLVCVVPHVSEVALLGKAVMLASWQDR